MIDVVPDMPDNITVLNIKGKVTGEDYKSVLIPAVQAQIEKHGKIRLVCHFDDEFSFGGSAMLYDATFGLKNLTKWEKLAIVSDVAWLCHSTNFFSFMIPGEVKVFSGNQLAEAKEWVSS
jgi:hypothetical protein